MTGPCCKMSAVFPNGFANIIPLRPIYEAIVTLIVLLFFFLFSHRKWVININHHINILVY